MFERFLIYARARRALSQGQFEAAEAAQEQAGDDQSRHEQDLADGLWDGHREPPPSASG